MSKKPRSRARARLCTGCGVPLHTADGRARYCDECRAERKAKAEQKHGSRSVLDDIVEGHTDPNPDEADLEDWV